MLFCITLIIVLHCDWQIFIGQVLHLNRGTFIGQKIEGQIGKVEVLGSIVDEDE